MFGAISTTAFIFALSGLVTGVTSVALAIFVVIKNPRSEVNRSWGLFCTAVSIWGFGGLGLGLAQSPEEALFWGKMSQVGGSPMIAPAFYHFILSFVGATKAKRQSLVASYLIGAFFVMVNLLSPLYFTEGVLVMSSFYWVKGGPLLVLMLLWWALLVIYAHILFYREYRSSPELRRNQIRLIFCGVAVGYLGGLTEFLIALGIPIYPHGNWAIPFAYIATTYAIIKHKAMDIQTVIHKTAAWLALSSLIAIPVATFFFFGHQWLGQLTSFQHSFLVAVLVLLLIPYSRFIQPRIDHLFQRRKYDMQKILQGLLRELASLKDLDSLINKISNTIQEALYISKMTVVLWEEKRWAFQIVKGERDEGEAPMTPDHPFLSWVKEQDRVIELEEVLVDPKYESIRPFAQSYFKRFNARIALPLMHDGKLIGLVNLGEKDNLKSFSRMDLEFLVNLRAEASIALSNSFLYEDVSQMSKELRQWASELEKKVDERTRELAESKRQLEESYQKLQELDQLKSNFLPISRMSFGPP